VPTARGWAKLHVKYPISGLKFVRQFCPCRARNIRTRGIDAALKRTRNEKADALGSYRAHAAL
jgi:hypothetical protein